MKLKTHRFINYNDVKLIIPDSEGGVVPSKPTFEGTELKFENASQGYFVEAELTSNVGKFNGAMLDFT